MARPELQMTPDPPDEDEIRDADRKRLVAIAEPEGRSGAAPLLRRRMQ